MSKNPIDYVMDHARSKRVVAVIAKYDNGEQPKRFKRKAKGAK